ncbi:MAG: class I SAM-dependent methyltransferase [Bacillota bacterium]
MNSLEEQYRNPAKLNTRINIHEKYSDNKKDWHLWLFEQMNISPNSGILEMGCGDGTFWLKNRDRIDSSWNLILSDYSEGMVESAKKNLEGIPNIHYRQFNIEDIPFEDNRFDILIANHMLYHVPNRKKALKEVRRVLKPGGTFYCSTIGGNHLKEFVVLLKSFDPNLDFPSAREHALKFGVENGDEQLQGYFSEIVYKDFPGDLNITDEKAIVDYLLSSNTDLNKNLVNDTLSEFLRFLASEKEAHNGVIHITKSTGLFESK